MKKYYLTFILSFLLQSVVYAANWLEMQNNEHPFADETRFWGFIQPTYTSIKANKTPDIAAKITSPITGSPLSVPAKITAYNGQTPLFNLLGPDFEHSSQLQLLRARAGVRGIVPETEERINYFLLVEAGNNGLTRENPIVITDATVTFNYIPGGRIRYVPGARIRVGLGRLPLGEEAMQGVKNMTYINFTSVTNQLLNERFVEPYHNQPGRVSSPAAGAPLAMSKINGALSGFRDMGIEVYDWYNEGLWEYAYAVMLSQGKGINLDQNINAGNYDITARLQASYVFQGMGPQREDMSAYIWHQQGKREFANADYSRIREGIGVRYLYDKIRLSAEYINARGMIYVSTSPPFNDLGSPAFEPVGRTALGSDNRANGYYLDLGWEFTTDWELDLRYDVLNKMTNSDYDQRQLKTWTLGLQYFYDDDLHFTINYDFRKIKVVHPQARQNNAQIIQGSVADIISNTIGDRISAQLTWFF